MEKQKGFVTLASLILSALTGLGGIGSVVFFNSNALAGLLNARFHVSQNEEASEHSAVMGLTTLDITPTPTTTPDVTPTPTPTPSVSPTPTPTPSISPTPTPGVGQDEEEREDENDDKDEEVNEHAGLGVQTHIQIQEHDKNESHGDHD